MPLLNSPRKVCFAGKIIFILTPGNPSTRLLLPMPRSYRCHHFTKPLLQLIMNGAVKPELVLEIAFEGIAASNRHKSGVALRFPGMNRWRKDKKPDEINTLDDLKKMLEMYGK